MTVLWHNAFPTPEYETIFGNPLSGQSAGVRAQLKLGHFGRRSALGSEASSIGGHSEGHLSVEGLLRQELADG